MALWPQDVADQLLARGEITPDQHAAGAQPAVPATSADVAPPAQLVAPPGQSRPIRPVGGLTNLVNRLPDPEWEKFVAANPGNADTLRKLRAEARGTPAGATPGSLPAPPMPGGTEKPVPLHRRRGDPGGFTTPAGAPSARPWSDVSEITVEDAIYADVGGGEPGEGPPPAQGEGAVTAPTPVTVQPNPVESFQPAQAAEADALAQDPDVLALAGEFKKIFDGVPDADTSVDTNAYDQAITAAQERARQDRELLSVEAEGVSKAQAALQKTDEDLAKLDTTQAEGEGKRAAAITDLVAGFDAQEDSIRQKRQQALSDEQTTLSALQDERKRVDTRQQEEIQEWKRQDAELREAVQKHEFTDFWAQQSTGDKILSAIGLFLGGFGAGLTGGQNQALQVIESRIETDLQRQKLEFEKKKESSASHRGLYAFVTDSHRAQWDRLNRDYAQIVDDTDRRLRGIESLRRVTPERINLEISLDERARLVDQQARARAWERAELTLKRIDLSNASMEVKARAQALEAALQEKLAGIALQQDQFVQGLQQRRSEFITNARMQSVQAVEQVRQNAQQLAQARDIATMNLGADLLKITQEQWNAEEHRQLLRELKAAELSVEMQKKLFDLRGKTLVSNASTGQYLNKADIAHDEDALKRFVATPDDPNVGFLANSSEDATKIKKTREFILNARGIIGRMKELKEEFGVEVFNRRAKAESKALGESLILLVKDLFALGALQQHERELIAQTLPEDILSTWEWLGIESAKMVSMERMLNDMEENIYKNFGLPNVEPLWTDRKSMTRFLVDTFKPKTDQGRAFIVDTINRRGDEQPGSGLQSMEKALGRLKGEVGFEPEKKRERVDVIEATL